MVTKKIPEDFRWQRKTSDLRRNPITYHVKAIGFSDLDRPAFPWGQDHRTGQPEDFRQRRRRVALGVHVPKTRVT
jgi:hypothetical protein